VVAVDTDIVVRLLTADDPRQTDRTRRLFEAETIFLAKTVLLATRWVLRRMQQPTYRASTVCDAIVETSKPTNCAIVAAKINREEPAWT
jgi:predicted nucleic-acid-binding protein